MCRGLSEGPPEVGREVLVVKFGSSLLTGPGGYRRAVDELGRDVRSGRRIVAVVSARRGVTDRLLGEAGAVSARPDPGLMARLLGTGEEASAALLGLALTEAGIRARVLGADELGLRTVGSIDDAEPADVDLERIRSALASHDVVVVPGFVGRDGQGRPTLLGRGGSDFTALYLGRRLEAGEIRLVKDVDGVFEEDPGKRRNAVRLRSASWDDVARVGDGVVQPKALRFAKAHGLGFRVAAVGGSGTCVGPPAPTRPP